MKTPTLQPDTTPQQTLAGSSTASPGTIHSHTAGNIPSSGSTENAGTVYSNTAGQSSPGREKPPLDQRTRLTTATARPRARTPPPPHMPPKP